MISVYQRIKNAGRFGRVAFHEELRHWKNHPAGPEGRCGILYSCADSRSLPWGLT